MSTIGSFTVSLFNAARSLFNWPVVVIGIGPDGKAYPMAVNPDGSLPPSTGAGTARTTQIIVATDSSYSPVGAGAKSVAFLFSPDFAGTIAGSTIDPTKVPPFGVDAPPGDTLAAITYTCTSGQIVFAILS